MAAFFLDASALVKRYAQEVGTPWVQALAAPAAGHSLFIVRITLAETVAALTGKERGGFLTSQNAATALAISTTISAANTSSSRCPPPS